MGTITTRLEGDEAFTISGQEITFLVKGGEGVTTVLVSTVRQALAAFDAAQPVPEPTPEPEPQPEPTPEPVPEPVPEPPHSQWGSPVVGQPFAFRLPVSGETVTFNVTSVVRGQTFTSVDTALLLNQPGAGNGRCYVDCVFRAGRYALWMNDQRGLAFIGCTFIDDLAGSGDEATVRLQSCSDVLFQACTIEAYGGKHAFRVHGTGSRIAVVGLDIDGEGNGQMHGRYQGGPVGVVNKLEMYGVVMHCAGPDVLNTPTDGSLTNFRCENWTVSTGQAGAWWRGPAAGLGAALGWTFTNFRRI